MDAQTQSSKSLGESPGVVSAPRRRPADRRRISRLLRDVADAHAEPRITIWQLRDAFGERAHGALLFAFALLNFIPMPPGGGIVLALPVLLVAVQLVMRAKYPYLPAWIGKRSFKIEDFRRAVDRIVPLVQRVERLLRPRLVWLSSGLGERFVGVVCLVLAIVLFLPVPVAGNWPPALAICLLAVAVLQQDGLAVVVGLLSAALSVAIGWATLMAALKVAVFFLTHLFG